MKKLMMFAAVLFTAGIMASCNGEGCYKVTCKTTTNGSTTETVTYVYGNSEDVDLAIEKIKAAATLLGGEVKATRQKINANESDCVAKNNQ